jgi:Uma2 family endonuclease
MSIALKEMTVDEFLLWTEGQEGRWELHDGVAKRITPERADHVRTKGEAFVALRFASRRAGCDCEVFGAAPGSRSTNERSMRRTALSFVALSFPIVRFFLSI